METVKHIKIKDYNYPLTDVRIAKYPLSERDHSKLFMIKEKSRRMFFITLLNICQRMP